MDVRHERASQRMHQRVTAPLWVTLDGATHRARDWSLGGLALNDYAGTASAGEVRDLDITIPFQGFSVEFRTRGRVVRHDADAGELAVQFEDLGERAEQLLTHFLDELVRGSMAEADETIRRIDIPVTPTETDRLRDQERAVPLRRQRIRRIVMSTLYVVLGAAVFSYLALVLYSNIFRLEVDTAVLAAPLQGLSAARPGRVDAVPVREGQRVKAGDTLARIANADIRRDLADAGATLTERRARVQRLERKLAAEKAQAEAYLQIARNDVDRLQTRLTGLEKRVANASDLVARYRELRQNRDIGIVRLSEARLRMVDLRDRAAEARLKLRQRRNLLKLARDGIYFNQDRFVGNIDEIRGKLAEAREAVAASKTRKQAVAERADSLIIRAPTTGRVKRIRTAAGSTVGAGDVVVVFERLDEKPVVHAFLTQDQVVDVTKRRKAFVFFPATGRRVHARVTRIDRTGNAVDPIRARYNWQGDGGRTAVVTLAVPALNGGRLDPGTPAVVVFDRDPIRNLFARLAGPPDDADAAATDGEP